MIQVMTASYFANIMGVVFINTKCSPSSLRDSFSRKTQTSSVLELKIHVSNDIKNGAQYYLEQGNKKIHLQELIFDELVNSDNIIDYICEGYAPIILLFYKILFYKS